MDLEDLELPCMNLYVRSCCLTALVPADWMLEGCCEDAVHIESLCFGFKSAREVHSAN